MKTLVLIFLLSGLAFSQSTTTHTDCSLSDNRARCTSKTEEDIHCYQEDWVVRCVTQSEHEQWLAQKKAESERRAAARAEESAERQRQEAKREAFLATPEGQRQARLEYESKQQQEKAVEDITRRMWMSKHPQYKETDGNNQMMTQFIIGHGLYLGKTKSYDKAYKELSKAGLLEK